MNWLHHWYCRSGHWRRSLQTSSAFRTIDANQLGEKVLELGPGPGLTTEWLRTQYPQLTCLEFDRRLANSLSTRMSGITVVCGDATAMPFPDAAFSGVVALNMLHHIPSPALQDRLFAEAGRVLCAGGTFIGCDRLGSLAMSLFHIGDTMTLLNPDTLDLRLKRAGFADVQISRDRQDVVFVART